MKNCNDFRHSLSSIHLQLSSSGTGQSSKNIREVHNTQSQIVIDARDENNNPNNQNKDLEDADATIIIQPNDSIRGQFFSSSVKLFRILQNSPFQAANIVTSRTNINKGIQIVTIKDKSKLSELLELKNLGGYAAKCYRPTPQNHQNHENMAKCQYSS